MKELSYELSLRDIIVTILLLIFAGVLLNLNYISSIVNRAKIEDYQISAKAKVLSIEPKTIRVESEVGSRLHNVGYRLKLSYTVESIEYVNEFDVRYSRYPILKMDLDALIYSDSDSISILVKESNPKSVIIDYSVFN